jgi:hypothetical protein
MSADRGPLAGARALLRIADKYNLPDKYWRTDRVIGQAREQLGVPVDGRYTHAHLWGSPAPVPAEQP